MNPVLEEDDPVVQEIPVYLSQALAKNLYIYQFPVRPANRDWRDVTVSNASIKPKNQMVRLEVSLDTYSDKYCPSKGEQIAINTDGCQDGFIKDKEKEKFPYFRNCTMDKIVYESQRPCVDTHHYAAAILQDKELHITPIQGVLQLKPSYSYYDKQDKRKSDKNKANNSDEEEPEAKQVTVKFARQETDVAKKAREKSYEAMAQRLAQEAWYDGLWKHSETDHAELERLKLFSQTTSEGSALTLRSKEYVRALVPRPLEDLELGPTEPKSVQQQIKNALVNAKLLTFSELRTLVRTEDFGPVSEATLLSALSAAACCVRGLWAPRSDDLYPGAPNNGAPSSSAPVSGAPSGVGAAALPPRLLCAARDHVLYLFTQHPYIDRRKVSAAVRLPPLEVLTIIRSVARFNPRVGWELLLPPDTAFETKYPDVIQRQNLYWEARQRQFNEMLIGEVPKRQRKKSQRESLSESMLSPKPRCNSVSEEESSVKRQKNKSTSGVGKRTRNVSSSSAQDC